MKNFLKRFFEYVKGNGGVEYTAVTIGNDFSEGYEKLVKKNRNLLSDHGINLNKVRFVYTPTFFYDVEKNIINPSFTAMLPSKKSAPIIEIGKPKNVVEVKVAMYHSSDNYGFMKDLAKNSKKGIVIYIKRFEDAIKDDGTKFTVEEGVAEPFVKLVDLDDVTVEIEETEQIL